MSDAPRTVECPNCCGNGGFGEASGEPVCELCEGECTLPEGWNEPPGPRGWMGLCPWEEP
jgi:hypothetical protein